MKSSICMTSYNGSKYIKEQIDSILSQIDNEDEIIICDDSSTDNTVEVINNIVDGRIKLFINKNNIGVLNNYANCLSKASNELIFLSDQDDIWNCDKVAKIKDKFNENPDVTLVLTNAMIIDGENNIIQTSFLNLNNGKSNGVIRALENIVKNKYLGGAIAFKRSELRYILPFVDRLPMHDMWIGILNDIYGKTYYIDEALIQYRRHDSNVSPYKHKNILWRIQWRLNLIACLIQAIVRK